MLMAAVWTMSQGDVGAVGETLGGNSLTGSVA